MVSIGHLLKFLFLIQILSYNAGEAKMKAIDKSDSGKNQVKLTEKAKKEHIDAAFVYFSTACVEAPEFSMAYYKRGKCYMMMHDYKRALYDFSAAILNETRYSNKQHYG